MDNSRKPALEKFRQLYVEPYLAQLRNIQPNQQITLAQHKALQELIDTVRVLWKMINLYDDELEEVVDKVMPGQTLLSLHINHPEKPEVVWDAFVMAQTEYLNQSEKLRRKRR